MKSPTRLTLLPCALAVLLAACGGSDSDPSPVPPAPTPTPTPADPLAAYRTQTVNWAMCDPTILGHHSEDLDALGERAQCATVRVPLDYEAPERGDAVVAMLRVGATQPQHKRGALFFNPGGPGGDGLGMPVSLGALFALGNPESETGHLMLRLSQEFDLIGFSPRGVGASTNLTCATNELARATNSTSSGLTPENIDDLLYNARKIAEACAKNPLTPHINSDYTVRDMDLMRELLGEEKLHYLGYSYGTWLGAWYGSRFPERLERTVLDSNMDFTASMQRAELSQPGSFQRVFDQVLVPYAIRHADTFNLGQTPDAVRAAFLTLPTEIQQLATGALADHMYKRRSADRALEHLGAARGLNAVLAANPGATPEQIDSALQEYRFVPASATADAAQRALAQELYETLQMREPESIFLPAGDATYAAVMCNDTPFNQDPQFWIDAAHEQSQTNPVLGIGSLFNACIFWPESKVTKPGIEPLLNKDILMVQSQYDGATDTEGALNAFGQLPAARLIYVAGEHQHGIFPYGTDCVDAPVARHLLGEPPAARETQCETHPLPLDAEPQATLQRRAATPTPTYIDPAKAAEITERIRDTIATRPSR